VQLPSTACARPAPRPLQLKQREGEGEGRQCADFRRRGAVTGDCTTWQRRRQQRQQRRLLTAPPAVPEAGGVEKKKAGGRSRGAGRNLRNGYEGRGKVVRGDNAEQGTGGQGEHDARAALRRRDEWIIMQHKQQRREMYKLRWACPCDPMHA
jgi:hypothetical protein